MEEKNDAKLNLPGSCTNTLCNPLYDSTVFVEGSDNTVESENRNTAPFSIIEAKAAPSGLEKFEARKNGMGVKFKKEKEERKIARLKSFEEQWRQMADEQRGKERRDKDRFERQCREQRERREIAEMFGEMSRSAHETMNDDRHHINYVPLSGSSGKFNHPHYPYCFCFYCRNWSTL